MLLLFYGKNGALAKIKNVEKLSINYYTVDIQQFSLGYAGLCECTRYMKGVSHTDEEKGTPICT